jgi:hypothetical protein
MDARRFDFKDIQITGQAVADGDKAFDEEDIPTATLSGIAVMPA